MAVKKETIIRVVVALVALINAVLTMLGKNPLPWSDDQVYQAVSAVIVVVTTMWSMWKNNSFTTEACIADEYLKDLKANKH